MVPVGCAYPPGLIVHCWDFLNILFSSTSASECILCCRRTTLRPTHMPTLMFLWSLGTRCFTFSGTWAGDTREGNLIISVSCQVRDSTSQPEMVALSWKSFVDRTLPYSKLVQCLQENFGQMESSFRPCQSLTDVSSFSNLPAVPHLSVQTDCSTLCRDFPSPEPRVLVPKRFSGDCKKFWANSCELYFSLLFHTFSLEVTNVGFIISLLQNETQSWVHLLLEQCDPTLATLDSFFSAMSQVYTDPFQHQTAEAILKPGTRIHFFFIQPSRLNENKTKELARSSIQIDQCLWEKQLERISIPCIDWLTGIITFPSNCCQTHCTPNKPMLATPLRSFDHDCEVMK